MKHLQIKYSLLHFMFFISYCAVVGYTAIFLQSKGMSNSEIGIVTGIGAASTIFLSPIISSLVGKIKGLTVTKLLVILYMIIAITFIIITLITLPTILLMVLYMLMIALTVAIIPFLSTICMDYVQTGIQLDFGLARGMGSLSYAIAAVVLGQLIDLLNPDVLMYTFLLSATLFLIDLFLLPKTTTSTTTSTKEKEGASLPYVIMKYKKFSFILLGFSLAFAAAVALSTYLINIVKALGGSTSLYGIAIFLMAVSEIPAMAYVTKRYQKLGAEKLLCIAIIAYVIRNLIIATAFNIPMLLIGMMFQSVSYGVFTATSAYYVSEHLLPEHQIMGQTFIAVMSSGFGSTIGNILGGFLQDAYGLQSMLLFSVVITILGAIIVLSAIKLIKE